MNRHKNRVALYEPVFIFNVTVILMFGQCYGLHYLTNDNSGTVPEMVSNGTPPFPLNSMENFMHNQRISLNSKQLRDCPDMSVDMDLLTQNQFSKLLTNDCRYDKLTKPDTINGRPLNVTVKLDIKHIEAVEQLQLRMDMLVQYRYMDPRLNYEAISPNRGSMVGRETLTKRIWVPHLIISNERSTNVMGFEGKDQFLSISPEGEVAFSYRMSTVVYCWMNLKKFPFDKQTCNVNFQSWTYNASKMMLYWEAENSVKIAPQLHLTEFVLEDFRTYGVNIDAPIAKGAFVGNYSALVFQMKIAREVGFYIMDYFIPSVMLVCTSWVTFWLQADNGAPRTTLGTSTMLSFITLASAQSKNLPKVSYIKVSEIWFLGCAVFIFAAMVEFAFVNIIWRRRKQVEIKKLKGKYIVKSALVPSLTRKEVQLSRGLEMTQRSNENLDTFSTSSLNVPIENSTSCTKLESVENGADIPAEEQTWISMTPQEVANWIDRRSRILFPLSFLIFNIFFWIFVFCF